MFRCPYVYTYSEFDASGDRDVIITEEEIMKVFWPYWCEQMRKVNKDAQITPKNCMWDFTVITWAERSR